MTYDPQIVGQKVREAVLHGTPENPVYLFTHEDEEREAWEICWRVKGKLTGGTLVTFPFKPENRDRLWEAFKRVEEGVTEYFVRESLFREQDSHYNC